MREFAAAAVLLLALAVPPAQPQQAAAVEVGLTFGGWTLAPFHPLLEEMSGNVARRSFEDIVGSSLLAPFLSPLTAQVRFGASTGSSISAVVWLRLGRSRFSIGLRADAFSFRLPFSLEARESVGLVGIPLASVEGRSAGTVLVRGLGASVLGKWTVLETRGFEANLQAGVMLIPWEGTIEQDISAVVSTPLGNVTVSGPYDTTIKAGRAWSNEIPAAVLSPVLAAEGRLRLTPNVGIFANLTLAQGTFFSGGVFFAL